MLQTYSNQRLPLGETQPARVMDNNDPLKIGRVRVQFPWQEDKNQMTPWIRLIQPHSGAGKGFHFIPEIGEEVLVGFESGNAEKPFVMGTHYNGSETSSYHSPNNDLKAIKTRSGIENISNDAEGSWKQSTPDGNFLHFDGQGNATLNVPKDLLIQVGGNLNINVGENQTINVSMNATETVGMNKTLGVGMVNILNVGMDFMTTVVGKMVEFVKGSIESHTEEGRKMQGKEVDVNSETNINANASGNMKRNSGEKSNDY